MRHLLHIRQQGYQLRRVLGGVQTFLRQIARSFAQQGPQRGGFVFAELDDVAEQAGQKLELLGVSSM